VQKSVLLATSITELGLVPADKAKASAQEAANDEGLIITIRDPVTDKVIGRAKSAKKSAPAAKKVSQPKGYQGQAPKAKKPATARPGKPKAAAKAPRAWWWRSSSRPAGPRGVTRRVERAYRLEGCALEAAFSNPNGTGYCDRWNYKFKVVNEDGGVRYQVVKK
jgi:hypothetical protein